MEKAETKHRKYDSTFKANVLRQVSNGQPAREVARAMGISENLIYTWRMTEKKAGMKEVGSVELSRELEVIRSKLKQTEMERDILKKALSIFSRQV